MLRDIAKIFVESLEAPSIKDIAKFAGDGPKRNPGSCWCLDDSISPYELYTYLKARFGPPNGLSMLFRRPTTDNLIQWHYTLLSGGNTVEIWGLNTRTEIWIAGYPSLTDADWSALVSAIKADFRAYGKELKQVRKSLEHWSIFYNPFHRLNSIIARLEENLKSLDLANVKLPPQPHPFGLVVAATAEESDDLGDFGRKFEECARIYSDAQVYSASLRTLTPVWAESFVNLLIFVLARPELKQDNRLYEDYRRKEIDIRVKLLHMNCQGFTKQIDSNANEFKQFHRLMNERNDILHGNTDPKRLAFRDVYFDHMIPLFPESLDFSTTVLRHSMVGIEADGTLQNVVTIRDFIEFVLGHMQPSIRMEVKQIMETRDPGWREETQRIGLLFSNISGEAYVRLRT